MNTFKDKELEKARRSEIRSKRLWKWLVPIIAFIVLVGLVILVYFTVIK